MEETDFSSGVKSMMWFNKADGFHIKTLAAGRNIYLADKSVTSKIAIGNLDNELIAKVEKKIPDIRNVTMLKVKAKVNSYTENLSVESQNFPGQKFEGTVNGAGYKQFRY